MEERIRSKQRMKKEVKERGSTNLGHAPCSWSCRDKKSRKNRTSFDDQRQGGNEKGKGRLIVVMMERRLGRLEVERILGKVVCGVHHRSRSLR